MRSFTGLLDKCQRNSFINDCLDLLLLCFGLGGVFSLWFCLHMFECYFGWSIVQFMFINSFIMCVCERVRVWECCFLFVFNWFLSTEQSKRDNFVSYLFACVCTWENCADKRPLEAKTYLKILRKRLQFFFRYDMENAQAAYPCASKHSSFEFNFQTGFSSFKISNQSRRKNPAFDSSITSQMNFASFCESRHCVQILLLELSSLRMAMKLYCMRCRFLTGFRTTIRAIHWIIQRQLSNPIMAGIYVKWW